MSKILITGATGNTGYEVIHYLFQHDTDAEVIAGVRNIEKAKKFFAGYPQLSFRHFDFEDPKTFSSAFQDIDTLFLLRPPHISDIPAYFAPLVKELSKQHVKQVVFLSVQGAERSNVIPHRKIEKLLLESSLDYIFVRPSYFMQNLTTTLIKDIREKRKIVLPAGNARFNWVDVKNISEASALLLMSFDQYKNGAYEITGYENKNFYEAVELIKRESGYRVEYQSKNPIAFYRLKRKEGLSKGLVIVMLLLHFLPRFQKEPRISRFYEKITGKKPITLKEFVRREAEQFKPAGE